MWCGYILVRQDIAVYKIPRRTQDNHSHIEVVDLEKPLPKDLHLPKIQKLNEDFEDFGYFALDSLFSNYLYLALDNLAFKLTETYPWPQPPTVTWPNEDVSNANVS